jgi:hypothetical protein
VADLSKEITDLLSDSCKAAPEMTHGLKIIGDGDMKKGMLTVAEYFTESGIKKGAIRGTIGTLTVIGLITEVKKLYDVNKAHKQKGEKIVEGLQKGIEEYNKEKNIEQEEEG